MNFQQEICALLQTFQDGCTKRDLAQLDSFIDLFTPDAELIGTNGVKPNIDEWYTSRDAAKEMIRGDWEFWGDLHLDLNSTSIRVRSDVGWIAASATVTKIIGDENYESFLEFIQDFIDKPGIPVEQK
jgi:hypothetical protein